MSISKERIESLIEFQKKYNLDFSDINLLNQAFVHTSYTNENNISVFSSYEKLEFYGDAVLKLCVSDFLFNSFPDYTEGQLTKLRAQIVSDRNIFEYAKQLGFEDLIVLGKNEKKQSILACAFEALLGAIFIEYKEKGYEKAKNFLSENFLDDILSFNSKIDTFNPKAVLQEYTQSIDHKLPKYNVVSQSGKEHKKTFFVEVSYRGKVIGKGSAKTIKSAEENAAVDAVKNLNIKGQQ